MKPKSRHNVFSLDVARAERERVIPHFTDGDMSGSQTGPQISDRSDEPIIDTPLSRIFALDNCVVIFEKATPILDTGISTGNKMDDLALTDDAPAPYIIKETPGWDVPNDGSGFDEHHGGQLIPLFRNKPKE